MSIYSKARIPHHQAIDIPGVGRRKYESLKIGRSMEDEWVSQRLYLCTYGADRESMPVRSIRGISHGAGEARGLGGTTSE